MESKWLQETSGKGTSTEAEANRLRVLIVDDYEDAGENMALLVRLWGHDAQLCRTGQEALEAALGFRPEVAFLDIMMPKMGGLQLAQRLREEEELKSTVLIAVTGMIDQDSQRRSREMGFFAYLLKPVDPEQLQAILTALADQK